MATMRPMCGTCDTCRPVTGRPRRTTHAALSLPYHVCLAAGSSAPMITAIDRLPRTSAMNFQGHFQLRVQKQLDAIEAIREDLTAEGLSVPGVVVVGAQSTGKSSVLESFSGIQLPRGSTITTRVPLLLRLESNAAMEAGSVRALISTTADMSCAEEVQEHEIADKVREYTVQLAGEGGSVCDKPIHLKVFRRDSPNVTLIDLPGIAYCSADTSLTEDIAETTKRLVEAYIKREDMIIIVVVPAADDFASHEALKMAAVHDPDGVRTLGVVTKTDRIETGKGFASKMRADGNGYIKLKLGYIAVKNRNQEEVDSGMPLEQAREAERHFFESDPRMSGLDPELWGMDTVISRVVDIQSHKINEFIPRISKLVTSKIRELEASIAKLPPTFSSVEEQRAFFIDLVNKLTSVFKDLAATRRIPSNEDAHLAVAANTFERFQAFSGALKGSIPDFLSQDYHEKLAGMVRLTRGGSLSNFLSHPVFVACVKEGFINNLAHHSDDLVDSIVEYVLETFQRLLEVMPDGRVRSHPIPEMESVSMKLRQYLMQEVADFTKEKEKACRAHVSVRNAAEEYIFTLDDMYGKTIEDLKHEGEPDSMSSFIRSFFSGIADAFVSMFKGGNNEVKALCELHGSLKAYVSLRSRSADDDVARVVHHFLVNSQTTQLAKHLYAIPDAKLAELMAEDFNVARDRKKLTESLERFKRARDVLKKV